MQQRVLFKNKKAAGIRDTTDTRRSAIRRPDDIRRESAPGQGSRTPRGVDPEGGVKDAPGVDPEGGVILYGPGPLSRHLESESPQFSQDKS